MSNIRAVHRCKRAFRRAETRSCFNRGSIGPDGDMQQVDDEVEQVLCVLVDRKPLAILHAGLPGARMARKLAACGIHFCQKGATGPLVVWREQWRARAAGGCLQTVGAWPNNE